MFCNVWKCVATDPALQSRTCKFDLDTRNSTAIRHNSDMQMNIFRDLDAYELPSSDFFYTNLNYNKNFKRFLDGFLWAHQEKLEWISPMQRWNGLFDNGKILESFPCERLVLIVMVSLRRFHTSRTCRWASSRIWRMHGWAPNRNLRPPSRLYPYRPRSQKGTWRIHIQVVHPKTRFGLWRCYCWRLGECLLQQAFPQRKVK
jgi:hypothetical protein